MIYYYQYGYQCVCSVNYPVYRKYVQWNFKDIYYGHVLTVELLMRLEEESQQISHDLEDTSVNPQ